MRPTLVITVGLPGAGKTDATVKWVAEAPKKRARVNRDLLRIMMHGGWLGTEEQEDQVTLAQHAAVLELLKSGHDVAADDTNLNPAHRKAWIQVAKAAAARLEVWDFTDVPVGVCLVHNANREGDARLEDQHITGMNERWIVPARSKGRDPLRDVRRRVTLRWS